MISKPSAEVASFPRAMRGYDPDQVDALLADWDRWATDAQARSVRIDSELAEATRRARRLKARVAELQERAGDVPPHCIRSTGQRLDQIMGKGWEAAQHMRAKVLGPTQAHNEDAERRARRLIETARARSARVSDEVRRERERMVKELEDARRLVQDLPPRVEADAVERTRAMLEDAAYQMDEMGEELERLYQQHGVAVGELARLRNSLESVGEK